MAILTSSYDPQKRRRRRPYETAEHLVPGFEEDLRRQQELLGEAGNGYPNVICTSLPETSDLSKPSELTRLLDIAERRGDDGFEMNSVWGDDMEVRIRRPLPPPYLL